MVPLQPLTGCEQYRVADSSLEAKKLSFHEELPYLGQGLKQQSPRIRLESICRPCFPVHSISLQACQHGRIAHTAHPHFHQHLWDVSG